MTGDTACTLSCHPNVVVHKHADTCINAYITPVDCKSLEMCEHAPVYGNIGLPIPIGLVNS